MRLTDLLALSHVPRWSIVRHAQPQSVADHSYRVAIIMVELAERLSIELTVDDLFYALWHDGAESRSGDISGPFKHSIVPPSAIGTAESVACPWLEDAQPPRTIKTLVKVADLIEVCTFISMNQRGPHAAAVSDRCLRVLLDACPPEWAGVVTLVVGFIQSEQERG